ncbi:phosphatase PAP2 family protein [uncultured Sphaerochaeta sp.]|uniref:phosphatase PAP2 family protein n=1 Tax=uncultured Sphaerochaeta sp. TaxID=886478 RepID=UPI002A0A1315|nr:phosphatase PAP2 family protein [uncultured Sphaerochaeta sp.]
MHKYAPTYSSRLYSNHAISRVLPIFALFFLLSFSAPFSLGAESLLASSSSAKVFQLNTKTDSLLLGSGSVLVGGAYGLQYLLGTTSAPSTLPLLDTTDINWFDRQLMHSYDKTLDVASDVLLGFSCIIPGAFAFSSQSDLGTVGVMYLESLLLSYGLKELGKTLFPRTRPYMYFDGYPTEALSDGDYQRSLPSGHTTTAFTSAAFTSYVFNSYYPDSAWKLPVALGVYGVATTIAILRVTSGNHFATDVLAGALIGTVSGILVPWLHKTHAKDSIANNLLSHMIILSDGLFFRFSV